MWKRLWKHSSVGLCSQSISQYFFMFLFFLIMLPFLALPPPYPSLTKQVYRRLTQTCCVFLSVVFTWSKPRLQLRTRLNDRSCFSQLRTLRRLCNAIYEFCTSTFLNGQRWHFKLSATTVESFIGKKESERPWALFSIII